MATDRWQPFSVVYRLELSVSEISALADHFSPFAMACLRRFVGRCSLFGHDLGRLTALFGIAVEVFHAR